MYCLFGHLSKNPDPNWMGGEEEKDETLVGAGSILAQVRSLSQAIRKVSTFEVRREIRRVQEASVTETRLREEGGEARAQVKAAKRRRQAERRLERAKAVNHRRLVRRLLADRGLSLPQKLAVQWATVERGTTAENSSETAEEESAAEGRLRRHKDVVAALRAVDERCVAVQRRTAQLKKKRRRREEREMSHEELARFKRFACGMSSCQARFRSAEDRAAHWARRHPVSFDAKVIQAGIDPCDPAVTLPKSKSNPRIGRPKPRIKSRRKTDDSDDHQHTDTSPIDSKTNDEEDLHPSWALKRKQAENAFNATFEGKTITFEDEESHDDE